MTCCDCDNVKSLFFFQLDDNGDGACLKIQKERLTFFCLLNNVFVAARDDTIWSAVSLCVGQCC